MAQPTGNRSSIMINGTQLWDYHLQEDDNYGELSRNPDEYSVAPEPPNPL